MSCTAGTRGVEVTDNKTTVRCVSEQKQMELDQGEKWVTRRHLGCFSDSCTHDSRYFARSLAVILLRVTVDAEFLNFKLKERIKREREERTSC